MKVAVIGAGIAGLTAARMLTSAGADVTVFDKSKGTGGRLSSRSFAAGWIDHGAPYLTVADEKFAGFLYENIADSAISNWAPLSSGVVRSDEESDFIGVPRNSALTRSLLDGAVFQPSTRIARIEATEEGWHLFNDGESLLGTWPHLIIAVPAPQALSLLREQLLLAEQIRRVKMEPCWVAAIQSAHDLQDQPDIAVYEHPVVRRIVHNSAKSERGNKNVYQVQASKSWSETHLEETTESVGEKLLQSFCELTSAAAGTELLFVHRWRYAFTETALEQACLWDNHLQLGVCGDWCLGRTIEDAWRSGSALAAQILKHQKEKAS
ncbi:MAG: FAD-dependent oxidoreductase [Desulfuromusa sp.]|jgi:predicted NAD/FAD-dependent oxidoreductase|nr:FAD-dependent oxidoreductase [Desulfuromusa sp.]